MSVNVGKGYRSWISQKTQKRKSLEKLVFLHKPYLKIKSSVIDNFPNHFSFYTVNCKDTEVMNTHIFSLDKIFNNSFLNSNTVVISDVSIKNNIATLL